MSSAQSERGFVLLTAFWLLILGTAMVASLMLHTTRQERSVERDESQVQSRLAIEGAVETVRAELIFYGQRSRWSQVPARSRVKIGGRDVDLALDIEPRSLPNVNLMSVETVAEHLGRIGFDATERNQILARLERMRSRDGLRSADELDALGHGLTTGICLSSSFDISGNIIEARRDGARESVADVRLGSRLSVDARAGEVTLAGSLLLTNDEATRWLTYRSDLGMLQSGC